MGHLYRYIYIYIQEQRNVVGPEMCKLISEHLECKQRPRYVWLSEVLVQSHAIKYIRGGLLVASDSLGHL